VGTPVQTTRGTIPIQMIEPGDHILSYDEGSRLIVTGLVTAISSTSRTDLVQVEVGGERIRCSQNHRFLTSSSEWVEASKLTGDKRLMIHKQDASGLEATPFSSATATQTNQVRVFNFTVQDFHTYFVGTNSVLVHNSKWNDPDGDDLPF
jgi:hypothetical protein